MSHLGYGDNLRSCARVPQKLGATMVTKGKGISIAACLGAAALTLLPMRAVAESAPSAQANAKWYVEQAQINYDVGQWDAALVDYEAAYSLTRDPTLLARMGDACGRKGDNKRAIDCYQNYLEKVPNASDRPTVEKHIQELQQRVERSSPASVSAAQEAPHVAAPAPISSGPAASLATSPPPAAPPSANGPATDATLPSPLAEQPSDGVPPSLRTRATEAPSPAPVEALSSARQADVAERRRASPPPAGRTPLPQLSTVETRPADVSSRTDENSGSGTRRIWGGVLMVSGISFVGLGGIFSWRTKSIESSINGASSFDADKYHEGQTFEALQWVCYGIGAGAAVTGLILYLTGGSNSSRLSLAPHIGPGSAGLGAQGIF